MMRSPLEELRHSFRPNEITTLFVGESPPHGGDFFYRSDSLLYRAMRCAFGEPEDFLADFKSRGFFLDDLVLTPINKITNKKARQEIRDRAVNDLAERIRKYNPSALVVVMHAIEQSVREAAGQAGLNHLPVHVAPFPIGSNYWPFVATIQAILPGLHLPSRGPSGPKDNR